MTVVLKGGTLVNGAGSPPMEDAVIIISGEEISYVGDGEGIDWTGEEEVIDLAGMTVLPGLIDAHTHQTYLRTHGPLTEQWRQSPYYLLVRSFGAALAQLREGVTTIREMGARGCTNLVMREATERGLILGPRIVTCGEPIAMTGGHAYEICVEADGVDGVRKAARKLLKDGVDLVKIMASHEGPSPAIEELKAKGKPLTLPQFTTEEIRAAVEEAHNAGKKAAAHVYGATNIRRLLEAGVDSIEHGNYLDRDGASEMADRGIFLVATFSVHSESANTMWERGELKADNMECLLAAQNASFQHAVEAGVPLAVGTDALGDMALEMKLMIDAGLKPMDAIVAATRGGAQLLGLEHEVGTVEPGKLADIVVVRGDPLADIMVMRDVEIVIQQGDILRPASFPDLPPPPLAVARSQRLQRL